MFARVVHSVLEHPAAALRTFAERLFAREINGLGRTRVAVLRLVAEIASSGPLSATPTQHLGSQVHAALRAAVCPTESISGEVVTPADLPRLHEVVRAMASRTSP